MSFTLREATAEDVLELAQLHVETWRDTYQAIYPDEEIQAPGMEIRVPQWEKVFREADPRVFCYLLVEDATGRFIGFASGRPFVGPWPIEGELSKIYLRVGYQRQGLGQRLLRAVTERFVAQGVGSMLLFADPKNPSCRFYEAFGAELLSQDGAECGACYAWRDLPALLTRLSP